MDQLSDHLDDPRHILKWFLDAGVDEAVGEAPLNRYDLAAQAQADRARQAEDVLKASHEAKQEGRAESPRKSARQAGSDRAAPVQPAQVKPAGEVSDDQVKSAVDQAQAAKTVDDLRAALEGFDGCPLKKTAMNLVFGDGNPEAKVVLIGEAPGADEDRQGLPFVGASGQLLDKMLASIDLDRSQVFISNTVYWRPPGNRTPHAGEIAVCLPFVERLIELIDPQVLITVGGPATHSVLAQQGSVSKLVGRWFTFETPRMSHPIAASAIYHPAYLLRSPAMKRQAWQNLLEIRRKLDELGV